MDVFANSDTEEVCQTESFRASCPRDNQVVVMTTARYGRMRLDSPCIDRNYGYIGCANDVITTADAACSGRKSCTMPVPNSELEREENTQCPRDFKLYLEASYRCQTGNTSHILFRPPML